MEQSILQATKKTLGLDPSYQAFDHDVITHINAVFLTLQQLGIGPQDGFMVEAEDDEWDDFIPQSVALNAIKTYMYLRVRLLFDPPGTPHHISALKDQIEELEQRLKYDREVDAWGLQSLSPSLP